MSFTVPPWLKAKDQAFFLFFSKVVTDTKEDDQTLQPFATAIYTELRERADSKIWGRFLNGPWTITTFTEQQWQWLLRDKEHGLLNLGTEKHQSPQVHPGAVDRSFHPLTQGGGWRSIVVQKANSAVEKHKRTPATCITPHQSSDPFLQTLDDLSIMLFEQHAYSNVAINISLVVIYMGLYKHVQEFSASLMISKSVSEKLNSTQVFAGFAFFFDLLFSKIYYNNTTLLGHAQGDSPQTPTLKTSL
ncbi:hypothetical protein GG344DRAFT_80976 [Lentinula edodes]|nr:hypothetical protein GG344DRAFT_80976 [Lentinula edodes]